MRWSVPVNPAWADPVPVRWSCVLQATGRPEACVIPSPRSTRASTVAIATVPRLAHQPVAVRVEVLERRLADEFGQKLPIELLAAGDTHTLIVVLSDGSGTAFRVALSWTNADDSPGERKQQVSV